MYKVLTLLLSILVAPVWAAPNGLRLVYDMSGDALTITRDAAGVFQLDGFPAPGLVLYEKLADGGLGTVYYQHPSVPGWLKVSPADLHTVVQRPRLAMGAPWQPYLGAPTRRYEVQLDGEVCDNWFTSPTAASMAGLNVADVVQIIAAVQFLNAGSAAAACERLSLPPAQAASMGLPLRLNGPNGPWALTTLEAAEINPIALPTSVVPINDDARLTIMLSQLSTPERTAFAEVNAGLPLAQQLAALEALLAASTSP
jgi:hypothetical protein